MDVALDAQIRSTYGKGAARETRREAMVPANLYGPQTAPLALSVSAKSLEKLLRALGEETRLIQLAVGGDGEVQNRQVLIQEVQVHPVRRRFQHVDFYEAPLDKPIVVKVPIETVNDSIGVKKGGTLNLIRRTLSVRCLPTEIPDRVAIDISAMDLGDTIIVGDLLEKTPFALIDDRRAAIVNIVAPEGAEKSE